MRLRGTLLAVLLVALLAACGSGEPATSTNDQGDKGDKPAAADGPDLSDKTFEDLTGESEVELDVRDNTFNPQYIEVKAGTPVTFANRGRNVHNVVPTVEGSFAEIPAGDLAPKDEATITFEKPGDYPYYCSLHGSKTKGMTGAVRVLQ